MSPLMVPVLLVLAATTATADNSMSVMPGCQQNCGGVDIPYPFGTGTGCFRKGFEVACINNNNGSAGEILVLATTDQTIRVLKLSVSPVPEARVLLPVAWQCFNTTGYVTGSYSGDVDFNKEGVYRISNTQNELFVLGCNTYAYTNGVRVHNSRYRYKYYTGCITVTPDTTDPRDGACAGLGCCHVDIPPGITDTSMTWTGWSHPDLDFCPCNYAFIVEKGNYTFKASDLLSTHIPNNQTMPLHVDWTMPLRLDWAIRDNGSTTSISCAQAPNKTDHEYACRSSRSECVDSTNGPGYFCNCTKGYEGNPYIAGGCTNINECLHPESYPCPSGSKCINTDGGYKCQCKFGRRGKQCGPLIPTPALALLATFVAGLFLALLLWYVHRDKKRRMKAAFFDKNGGKILKGAAGINIFTEKQLEKITSHYSNLIGEGAFGKVFKGTTDDNQQVAVKRSHNEGKDIGKRDNNLQQGDDIVNEITFQLGTTHTNLVRLVGCCLETNIPVLVFEFISKGSLHKLLHDTTHQVLRLRTRLNIAIGSAKALAYIHSNGDRIHGDIKSANILLDDNLQPKVSDFGSSKILSVDMYARAVSADMSYIDPVYMKTERFVAKSDVYSFSVVLLELTTRKTVKYGENKMNSLPVDFVKSCKEMGNGREMYDRDILSHDDGAQCQHCMECLDKIGTLAVRCLKEDVDERPTMAEVVDELKEAAKFVDKCKQQS
ncbi:wall-associated receptor kinase 2-like [Miscanthus floridulus]|uniref:wall-associated receptor kinase 2-like n=1 Tax=Miscanthus floridulus TaxID=154761 RepID=UPI00345ABDA0